MTRAEGPGVRFCLWVQGCSRHCPGCFAEKTWDPFGGKEMSVAEIQAMIPADRIDGITLLGGEPFEQAQDCAGIAEFAQRSGLGVITFTGGTLEQLEKSEDEGIRRLLNATDLLIDGDYRRDQPETERPLVGSQNQRFHFLTDRYTRPELMNYRNRFEIRTMPDGTVTFNGMGNIEALKNKIKELNL